ncbi:hypothetical protein FRC11_006856 [Ceratobasidium sp. 423]|nr:hypothetical protein FRC11_006856 [Ceratobasidium sp. 423]
MGWADLSRIINTHWGKPASPDPSSLWHNATLLSSKVKPGARPDYYSSLALALNTLEADVLDCWRLLLSTDNLDLYFTSLEEPMSGPTLFGMARKLVSCWASTQAHDAATSSPKYWDGPKSSDNRFGGTECDSDTPLSHQCPSQQNPPKATRSRHARKAKRPDLSAPLSRTFTGDHCLANSILRLRDLLWHYEFNWAVADGDIGRVMNIMVVWQFTFTGSGPSKYATELLELACGFFFEFPQPLQDTIKKNWLCNLSGMPGCWFPMDLMQEHNIRELKSKSQRRDEDFSGTFFQKVVSRNVRMFTRVRSAVSIGLNLHERGSAHHTKKRQGIADQLRRSLERKETHYYIPGRTFGWVANDDFMNGIEAMPAKLSRFLRKSNDTMHATETVDASNTSNESHLNTPNRPSSPDRFDDLEGIDENVFPAPQELPLPTIISEGQLVPGDILDDFITDDQLHSNPPDYPPEF